MKSLIALLLAFSNTLHAENEYEIRFMRFHKAAGKIAVSGKVAVDSVTTISIENRVVNQDRTDVTATVSGDLEILSAGPKGDVSSAKFTVTAWKGSGEEGAAGMFKPGDVIEVARGDGGKKDAKVNGADATEAQKRLARALMPVNSNKSVTWDDTFGPGKKVKVGDEWAINADAAVRDAEAQELKGTKPEHFSGNSRLEKIESADGTECAMVTNVMTFKGGGFSVPNSPETVKVRAMNAETIVQTKLPLNPDGLMRWMKSSESVEGTAAGQVESPDGDVTLSISFHEKESLELTFGAK